MISYGLIALECIIMGMIRKRAKSISAMNMSVVLTMNANTTLLRYVSRFRYSINAGSVEGREKTDCYRDGELRSRYTQRDSTARDRGVGSRCPILDKELDQT